MRFATVTVAAGLVAWFTYKLIARQRNRVSKVGKKALPLMATETSFIMMDAAPSISTITYFEGDHRAAAKFLRERVALIVRKNPWLNGRLDSGGILVFDPNAEGEELFLHRTEPLSRATPFANVATSIQSLLVKNGTNSVGCADEPQFRVSVVPDDESPETRWALVVSMSHVIADGHTFYQVHNMLSEDATLQALEAERKPHVMQAAAVAMGGDDGFLGRPKPGLLLSLVTSTAMGKIMGPACEAATYEIDEAFVARKKAEAAAEGVAFVSTNDIITSAICTATRADVGTMDVNFRDRLDGCSQTDAGNYEDKIVYTPTDYSSPALIRRSILSNSQLRRAGPTSELPESVSDFWRLTMITSVSNWSTFAEDVTLKGHRAELHLPLFDPAAVPARFFTGCFVFRARTGGALGVALAGSPYQIKAIEGSGLLGAKIGYGSGGSWQYQVLGE